MCPADNGDRQSGAQQGSGDHEQDQGMPEQQGSVCDSTGEGKPGESTLCSKGEAEQEQRQMKDEGRDDEP